MNIINEILTFVSGLMFLIFASVVFGWLWALICVIFGRRLVGTIIPLVPGIIGTLSLLIAPPGSDLSEWRSFWWVPLFADLGCVPWLIHFCVSSLLRKRRQAGNRLTQGETLLRALETRLFPYIESLGFVRDKRHEPRIVCFRRRTEIAMQIVAVEQQTPRESPSFSIEFTEAPLSGIDYQWMHIPPEDIFPGVYPGYSTLLRGLLIPERGKWMFCPASPWQRLFSKKRVDADGIVQRSMELFPEIIAWWECKAKGTHLIFFQPDPLPPVPSHAPVFGQPVVPTLLQNFFARDGVWRTGIYGAAAVYTLVGAILGWNLGEKWYGMVVVCVLIVLVLSRYFFKVFQHIRVWINGGPFHRGELVQVISGPYAGRIAAVYDEWPSVDKVSIDLGESEWKERKDVFSHVQLCRVKPVEPEK